MDEGRGYLLELLLTKLRYATAPLDADEEPDSWNEAVQIVGMSATMPNASAAATWLGARLYETMFRPVPLVKYLKVCSALYLCPEVYGVQGLSSNGTGFLGGLQNFNLTSSVLPE
jgi:replicative superfamily II helicase